MVTQLTDSVWWLDLGSVNAYLVDDRPADGENALTLIDAGMPWTATDLVDGIVEAGFTIGDLDRVLVTHYDIDHVGGLPRLEGFDVTVYAGSGDAAYIVGDDRPDWRNHKGLFQRLGSVITNEPLLPVKPLDHGDAIGSFTVYDTPGHTSGHVCYVSETLSTAFVGDMVRESDGKLQPSPAAISWDTTENRASIREFADWLPAVDVVAPGHGVPFREKGRKQIQAIVD
jgi:glyoxylase-like metal-dependent hydrolase (beta-lactamase superfamily II)